MKRPDVRGFSIVEVMIIVVIVGVLSLAGAPMYRQHVLKSARLEGEALLKSLALSQRMYYAEHREYYVPNPADPAAAGATSHDPVLNVRAAQNKVFNSYTITGTRVQPPNMKWGMITAWHAETTGEVHNKTITCTIDQAGTAEPVQDWIENEQ